MHFFNYDIRLKRLDDITKYPTELRDGKIEYPESRRTTFIREVRSMYQS